jgi:hypothetical protein
MYKVSKYSDLVLKNYLSNIIKNPIYPIGTGGGLHLSCFSSEKLGWKNTPFEPFVIHNIKKLKQFNVNICNDNNIYLEHRQIIMRQFDKPFEGSLHYDSFMDLGLPCLSCVYYYKIDKIFVGHTPILNKGITSVCNNKVWLTDYGSSKAFDKFSNGYRKAQVLEILRDGEEINILK